MGEGGNKRGAGTRNTNIGDVLQYYCFGTCAKDYNRKGQIL